MPIPFLNSIKLNKNQVEDFCVFNYSGDPTLSSGADFGYLWLNTSATPKVLKFWDGTNYRTLIDSTTISSSTAGTANDLSGGVAGSLPYQQGVGDTTFLGIGTADQVLTVNSGATAPQWLSQSSLSVGSAATATTATTATNVAGGANGSILVQSGAGTTGQLAIGASGYILTSNGTTPGWSATIPSTSVSGLAASATTDTTNASNISSGTLGLARLSLASGQFYVGDGSNNPAATAKSSIPLSGFGNAAADINIGGFKITNSGTIGSGDADSTVATKGYVDSVAQGLDVKASCLVATTADITLASPGAVTIDGIYSATDFTAGTTRILVKDQSAPAENGIYIWQGPSSAMTRSSDANTWDELVGAFTFIERGTANADSGWVCTSNAGGTLGTTAVTFVKFSQAGSYTPGNGIVQSGTSFNFAQSAAYTAGQIPFAGGTLGTSSTTIGFDSNFVWDDQANRLGIGTATPGATLDVTSNTNGQNRLLLNNPSTGSGAYVSLDFTAGTSNNQILSMGSGYSGSFPYSTGALVIRSNNVNGIVINTSGSAAPITFGINDSTAMTLNSSGLLVGTTNSGTGAKVAIKSSICLVDSAETTADYLTAGDGYLQLQSYKASGSEIRFNYANTSGTPTVGILLNSSGNVGIGTATPTSVNANAKTLHVDGAANAAEIRVTNNTTGIASTDGGLLMMAAANLYLQNKENASLLLGTNGTDRLIIDGSGNAGLGVTPKSWGSTYRTFQFGLSGSLSGITNDTQVHLANNAYFDSVNSRWERIASSPASRYALIDNSHRWDVATTGSPDTEITWTQAMTLDASGRLMVGTVTPYGVLTAKQSATDVALALDTPAGNYVIQDFKIAGVQKAGIFVDPADSSFNFQTATAAPLVLRTNNTARFSVKSTGQVNFVGLASDPAGAAGDVYYNSGSNVFKVYDTGWKTLPRKYSTALAGTSTTFDVTHNLGTQDVTVMVRKSASTFDVVYTDIQVATTNKVTIVFASSVTGSDYTVTVIG